MRRRPSGARAGAGGLPRSAPGIPWAMALAPCLLLCASMALPSARFGAFGGAVEEEEEPLCLMQKTLSLEHQAGKPMLVQRGEGRQAAKVESLPSAVMLEGQRDLQRVYNSLGSIEPKNHYLGLRRTLRICCAVALATFLLSIGLCCIRSRAPHWFLFVLSGGVVPKQRRQDAGMFTESGEAVHFPGPAGSGQEGRSDSSPSAPSHATTFSGSTRSLKALLSKEDAEGEVHELNLGTKTGSMALCITVEPASPSGLKVTVELPKQSGQQRVPLAFCSREEGAVKLHVCDAAETFAGDLSPAEGGAEPPEAGKCVYSLAQSRGGPVLTLEGPADGRPTPDCSSLIAKTANGATLGTLTLDEDDVEVTIMHSAMDSVVLVALVGFYVLKS